MLEALEKIKSAEEQNERKKEQLLAELTAYEASKKQMLQEKQEELRTNFSNALSEREQNLAQDLAAEEQILSRSAEE
ncbi:MAG: hypothetical protein ACLTXM_11230, partial [Enterococcus sp.]